MVKVTKENPDAFKPVTITLESQEEFDYLLGLTNGGEHISKKECDDYSETIDDALWSELNNIQNNNILI